MYWNISKNFFLRHASAALSFQGSIPPQWRMPGTATLSPATPGGAQYRHPPDHRTPPAPKSGARQLEAEFDPRPDMKGATTADQTAEVWQVLQQGGFDLDELLMGYTAHYIDAGHGTWHTRQIVGETAPTYWESRAPRSAAAWKRCKNTRRKKFNKGEIDVSGALRPDRAAFQDHTRYRFFLSPGPFAARSLDALIYAIKDSATSSRPAEKSVAAKPCCAACCWTGCLPTSKLSTSPTRTVYRDELLYAIADRSRPRAGRERRSTSSADPAKPAGSHLRAR